MKMPDTRTLKLDYMQQSFERGKRGQINED